MVTMRVEHIGLGWDFNKIGGFFAKHPEPRLNATRPLFGMERGRASKQEQVFNQPDSSFSTTYPVLECSYYIYFCSNSNIFKLD